MFNSEDPPAEDILQRIKRGDAIALGQILLGRELRTDELGAIAEAGMDVATGVLQIRAFLEQTQQLQMERHRFRFTPQSSARLVLIGEHATGVARALAARCELPVIGRRYPPHIPEWWDDLQEEAGPLADYLILEGNAAGEETVRTARSRGLRVLRMQAIEFGGLHPDAICLPKLPLSPPGVGGLHSALVVDAFLRGLPVEACRSRFTAETYHTLGYFERFSSDLAVAYIRDADTDAYIAELFDAHIRNLPLLRNPQDGSTLLHELYVQALAPLLGLDIVDLNAMGTESVTGPVWPIMPQLAAHHRLNYGTPLTFCRETAVFGLDTMIRRSYAMYRSWPRDKLAALFRPALEVRGLPRH